MLFNFDVQKFWAFANECLRKGFSRPLLTITIDQGLSRVGAVLSVGFREDEVRFGVTANVAATTKEEAKEMAIKLGEELRDKVGSLTHSLYIGPALGPLVL